MMTPFQRQKQIHWFNVLDADKNGFIERADFEEIGHRLATAIGFQPDNPIYDQIRAGMLDTWERMQADIDQNGDGRASLEEFLNFEDRMIYQVSPEQYEAYIGGNARGMAALADLDSDGALSPSEWRWQFHGFRLDDSQADESFQHIDTNGDGKITVEELIEAWRQFHFSEDPDAPGNWILGKLSA